MNSQFAFNIQDYTSSKLIIILRGLLLSYFVSFSISCTSSNEEFDVTSRGKLIETSIKKWRMKFSGPEYGPDKFESYNGKVAAEVKLLGRFDTDGGTIILGDPFYICNQGWPLLNLEAGEYEVWVYLDNVGDPLVIDIRKNIYQKKWMIEKDLRFSDGLFYFGNDSRHMVVLPGKSLAKIERAFRKTEQTDLEAYYWFVDETARKTFSQMGIRFDKDEKSDVILFGPRLGVVYQLYGINESGRCDRYLLFESSL